MVQAQLFEEPLLPSEVSTISWSQAESSNSARKYVERAQKLLHPLKPLQKHSNLEKKNSETAPAVNIDSKKPLHMLVCGDVTGNVVMCVHGQFSLGKLDMRAITGMAPGASLRVMEVHLSTDLSTLSVFHKTAGSVNEPAVLGLTVLDTCAMRSAQAELAHIVVRATAIVCGLKLAEWSQSMSRSCVVCPSTDEVHALRCVCAGTIVALPVRAALHRQRLQTDRSSVAGCDG